MHKRTLGLKMAEGALIFLLGILAILSLGGMNAVQAVQYTSETDFVFDAATGCITDYKGSDQNVNIPEMISGVTVKGIEWGAFSGNTNLTGIVLPGTIETIGSMAFEGCTGLSSIEIPSGVMVIAPYTFYGCSELKSVKLPSSVTLVMLEAFGGCTSLTEIELPEGVATLEDEAFADCSSLKKVTIPASVTVIGKDVFRGCSSELTIIGKAESYAADYAAQEGILFQEMADNDDKDIDQEAADNVIVLISQIGTVTLNSKESIETARSAYDALTANQKTLVTNYNDLTDAEDAYNQLKTEYDQAAAKEEADRIAATAVINSIASIGTVTLSSENAIKNARNAYDALTADQKVLVTNYSVLTDAEAAYNQLKAEYDQAAEKEEADRAAAAVVISNISSIGTVTLSSENAIRNARNAYDALTADQKTLVTNYSVLTDAEAVYNQLKTEYDQAAAKEEADRIAAEAVINSISSIGTVTLSSENAIKNARNAYDALTADQKVLVTNYSVLTDAEAALAKLKENQNSSNPSQNQGNNDTSSGNNVENSVQLSLNKTAATLYTQGQKTLTLQAFENGTQLAGTSVTWTSGNSKIAAINKNGKVTAKKKGKTTISATYKGVTVKCTITVKKPTLKLKKSKAILKVNKKVKIVAKATPAKKITYKSSNKSVATVTKKGVVTAKKTGKAKITVKANGVKKIFTVTVK